MAAAAAASSMARAPSLRRLTGHKGAVNDFFWVLSFFFNLYNFVTWCTLCTASLLLDKVASFDTEKARMHGLTHTSRS